MIFKNKSGGEPDLQLTAEINLSSGCLTSRSDLHLLMLTSADIHDADDQYLPDEIRLCQHNHRAHRQRSRLSYVPHVSCKQLSKKKKKKKTHRRHDGEFHENRERRFLLNLVFYQQGLVRHVNHQQ